jgi:DNA (cytosine-5)-methyltransferase 1
LNFGVPQNRERIFIIAFKDKSAFDNFEAGLPEKGMTMSKLKPLSKYIDFDIPKDAKYYYDSQRPMYEEIRSSVTKTGIVYQWRRKYVRQNKNNVCPTLTANMGMGGHNVPIIRTSNGEIRKLTPEECFRLMGFKDFKRPEGMSDAKLYKQAGNAVVVDVISSLASLIKVSLKV